MRWYSEFFLNGHSLDYLDNMNYWTFMTLTNAIIDSRKENIPSTSDKPVFKKLKPSQKKMIKERKKRRIKEGIKSGKRK